ncbi:MAG: P63C domain-containing protein [Nitrospiraceae bacterium]|nr:P63C domain-containing protein [Nitrospiraceae bacterium]
MNLFGDDETPQSKGGKARAAAVTADRRKEIAKKAAAARWQAPTGDMPATICGSADQPMRIPALGIEIPCYVIEGERRVLVQRGMVDALGMARGSAGSGGDRLASFVAGDRIKPHVDNNLSAVIVDPIRFRAPNGSVAYGYDAEVLHSLCLAVLKARRAGALQKQQTHIAERCEQLIEAWSLAGIISAVDEATGYQYVRARDAIEKVIDQWLVKELQPWKPHFPNEYYRRIFELNGWELKADTRRPGVVGHWTNDLVYDRLGPDLREQLHDFAGRNEKGRLRHHLTQFLTTNHGIPELRSHLDGIVALMKAATSWDQFKEMVQRVYPKPETTLSMALNDLDQIGKPKTLT